MVILHAAKFLDVQLIQPSSFEILGFTLSRPTLQRHLVDSNDILDAHPSWPSVARYIYL